MRGFFFLTLVVMGLLAVSVRNARAQDADLEKMMKASEKDVRAGIEKDDRLKKMVVEMLVSQLGSADYRLREEASARLMQMPESLPYLRRSIAGKDAESQRRMKVLIHEFSRHDFNRRMAELFKAKDEVPIDLVAEMMLQHKEWVQPEHWRQLTDITENVSKRISKNQTKKKLGRAHDDKFLLKPMLRGGSIFSELSIQEAIVAERVWSGDLHESVVVASHSIGAGHVVVSDLLMVLGPPPNGPALEVRAGAGIFNSFIYCEGDVITDILFDSVVIATGRVQADTQRQRNNVIIDDNFKSKQIPLFSTDYVGLKLVTQKEGMLVLAVKEKSSAENCGIRVGDLILSELDYQQLSGFERNLRRSFAARTDHVIRIRRGGREMTIIMKGNW